MRKHDFCVFFLQACVFSSREGAQYFLEEKEESEEMLPPCDGCDEKVLHVHICGATTVCSTTAIILPHLCRLRTRSVGPSLAATASKPLSVTLMQRASRSSRRHEHPSATWWGEGVIR